MNLKDDAEKLLGQYFTWLKDKTLLKNINDEWMEITTPHLDRHNDCLQIYLKKDGNNFLLTDDGYIIDDLTTSGCDLTTHKRKEILTSILNSFGVHLDQVNHQLMIHASEQDFPLKKHNLIQAMLAVSDLFYLNRPQIKSLFVEDITHWFESAKVRYFPMINLTGKSGFNHIFDFAIPKSQKFPERWIQTINNPSKQAVQEIVFKWLDTKDVRPESTLIAVLNDTSKSIPSNIIDAFRSYDLPTVLWSEKEKSLDLFVA